MKIHSDYRAHRFLDCFPLENGQINVSVVYPGITCAFHRHTWQMDYWMVVSGVLEVILVDAGGCKIDKQTYILKDGIYYSSNDPGECLDEPLIIVPGVWHGYRNIGNEPAVLLYYCSQKYNSKNPDEERITPKEVGIEFSQEIK